MPAEFKDYYQILGVERKASADDIRKAFRKLARLYHPDVAKDKAAAENKFKEINEAYEVLGTPEKRTKYDQLGADWNQPYADTFKGARSRTQKAGGAAGKEDFEFGGTGYSDFFERFFNRAQSPGGKAGSARSSKGEDLHADVVISLEEASHGTVRQITLRRFKACPTCGGSGEKRGVVCLGCNGSGQAEITETHKVKIPAGVGEGQKLRIAGRGDSALGADYPGDLYLNVRFAHHPDFDVVGRDLHFDLDIAPWEAALGTEAQVQTLEGPLSIRVPPGASFGQKLRVRGKGLGSREGAPGDLIVTLRVVFPVENTSEERELWTKLAQISNFRPRAV